MAGDPRIGGVGAPPGSTTVQPVDSADHAPTASEVCRVIDPERAQTLALPVAVALSAAEALLLQREPPQLAVRERCEANAPLEEKAIELFLSARDREAYELILEHVGHSPRAMLALQVLLLRGALPGEVDLAGRGTLLDNLAAFAVLTGGTRPGAVPVQAVVQLMVELAIPATLAAAGRLEEGVAGLLILMAAGFPAELTRLSMGMAAAGEVALASGAVLERTPRRGPIEPHGAAGQLLGPALMLFALEDDEDARPLGPVAGLSGHQLGVALAGILGLEEEPVVVNGGAAPADHARSVARIRAGLEGGRPVPAVVREADSLRERVVLVTALEGRAEGEPLLVCLEPSGRTERVLGAALGLPRR